MENKEKKKIVVKDKNKNLIITIIISSLAPLISRLLRVLFKDIPFPCETEDIIIIYFASLTGYVLSEKVYSIEGYRLFKGKIEIRFGEADAVRFAIWMIPVSLSVNLNSVIVISLLMILVIASLIILYCDFERFHFKLVDCVLIGIITIGMTILFSFERRWEYYCVLLASAIIVAFVFDVLKQYFKKADNNSP